MGIQALIINCSQQHSQQCNPVLFRLPVSKGVRVITLSAVVTTLVQECELLWGCSPSCAQRCPPRPGEHSLDPSVAREIRIW